jgi:transposase-like protein
MLVHCPLCQSTNIRKSRRRGLLESVVFTLIRVRPYRCQSCDSRFFRWAVPRGRSAFSPSHSKYPVRPSRSYVRIIGERTRLNEL